MLHDPGEPQHRSLLDKEPLAVNASSLDRALLRKHLSRWTRGADHRGRDENRRLHDALMANDRGRMRPCR
jgi:hypothetical protein